MLDVVARTSEEVFIPLTVGGGVRSLEDARRLLRLGADKVSVNSAAVARPELVREISGTFGAVRRRRDRHPPHPRAEAAWQVYTHGGRVATGIDALAWAVRCESWGRASWSSTPWTGTGPGRATTWS